MPLFARLAPLARELALPEDWRIPLGFPAHSRPRPECAALGPFRWRPWPAAAWSLCDRDGSPHSLEDYRGRSVLVVFYLGGGCRSCMEQLNVFAPMTKQFSDAGIALVAVSTETPAELSKTFAKAKGADGFPFPIVADPEFAAFKAYGAFDDFERFPLHGAFLIDAAGLVRWQDISYEPFRDAAWLLGEARRLLSLPQSRKQTAAIR